MVSLHFKSSLSLLNKILNDSNTRTRKNVELKYKEKAILLLADYWWAILLFHNI